MGSSMYLNSLKACLRRISDRISNCFRREPAKGLGKTNTKLWTSKNSNSTNATSIASKWLLEIYGAINCGNKPITLKWIRVKEKTKLKTIMFPIQRLSLLDSQKFSIISKTSANLLAISLIKYTFLRK